MPKLRWGLAVLSLILCAGSSPLGAVKPSEAIAAGYREVLQRLAAGDLETALVDLAGLEKNALGDQPSQKQIEGLWTIKLRVIREMIQAESLDVLIPVIVFHHEAAVHYRRSREPYLALHSRRMVDELADFYASRAEDAKADVFAGWVHASLGGYVQESRSFSRSRALFERALSRDPANEFALLAVGVSLEMHGRYWEAADYFERLIGLNPGHAEARLRWCLVRIKGKIPDEVEFRILPQLESVARDAAAPPWVRALAFQELASLHMRDERWGRAEAVLREGLAVVPNDQNQRVQLASLLERKGSRLQAREILRAIRPAPETGDSPRRRYDRMPTAGLEEGRETMRRMMATRLPLLSAGLGIPTGAVTESATERMGG